MSFHRENRLFSQISLDNHLRELSESIEGVIERLGLDRITGREEELIEELVGQYKVVVPVIYEDQLKLDAKETKVTLDDSRFGFEHDGGSLTVNGISITVEIPFKGSPWLFQCRPSTYTVSGTPEAEFNDSQLVLNYKTAEKDLEKIKALWMRDIKTIKDYLSWIERDLMPFNNSLKNNIAAAVRRRKKEASDTQDLINKLKQ